jgi:hypothetical protein
MSHLKGLLFLYSLWSVLAGSIAWGQSSDTSSGTPLMRMERQTRDEDVCILVRNDGQFHLERVALGLGKSRVFEGTLPGDSMSQLQQMLNVGELKQLSQSQIKMELVGEDLDQLLLSVNRANGWQSLNFTAGKSRKPFKNSVEPLVKWLERNMQQPHPLPPDTHTSRCMPPKENATESAVQGPPSSMQGPSAESTAQAAKNPYLLRIIEEHYVADSTTTAVSFQQSYDQKVERVCIVVYRSGRYRMERSKQALNTAVRADVYHDSLSEGQVQELQKLVEAPEVVKLDHQTAGVGLKIKEGEIVNLVIPRGTSTQKLSFASYFGVRSQEVGLRDNLHTGIDADLPVVKPLRNWLKANIENRKGSPEKDVPSTTCIPSIQPE